MSDRPKNQRIHLKTVVPGPKSTALRTREDAHIAPGLQGYAVMSGVAVDTAVGSAVTDVDGNTFIDLIGGIGVNALGHCHPKVVGAIRSQVEKALVSSFTSPARVDLVEQIGAHAPAGLDRVQLYSSGAEAVESALRLAKSHTGKYEFASFWGGFHGKTMGALSLMGSTFKNDMGPMISGSHILPYADCYRCPMKLEHPSCGLACVDVGRRQLKMGSAGALAAFVIEPMQGTAGNVIPPDDFLPAVASVADEFGALLIADEMITGFGRTGKYWGVDHSGSRADILTIGKAFGGGFPMSGLVTTDAISRAKPWSNASGSSSSFGGNPLGSAAAAAAVRAIDDEKLVENAKAVGDTLLSELRAFVDDYPFVGHVSGRGMFLRMELVSDKAEKTPLPRSVTDQIFYECVRRGLLTMSYAASFRLQPSLTMDDQTARNAVAALREVFDHVKGSGLWKAAKS